MDDIPRYTIYQYMFLWKLLPYHYLDEFHYFYVIRKYVHSLSKLLKAVTYVSVPTLLLLATITNVSFQQGTISR